MADCNPLARIATSDLPSMIESARRRLTNPGLLNRDGIRDDIRALERELASRPKRDPRKAEDWFSPKLVAAAKAAHAEHIRNLPRFAQWDELPIQSQDDWIRIANAAVNAYAETNND